MFSALSTFCCFSNLTVVDSFHTTVGARLLQTLVSSECYKKAEAEAEKAQ